jgi:hypothetical protein
MAQRIQDGKLFYHVTALENLPSIFENGLMSRADVLASNLLKTDVADEEIIEKRKELGILEYVPFHFFEPTAFTGAVFNAHPDKSFCSITITRAFAQKQGFKICTAHPLSRNPKAQILDYNEGISAIDWDKAEERDYDDEESKNSCMAECLATSPVKPEDFFIIFVPNEKTKTHVERLAIAKLGFYTFDIIINQYLSRAQND